jgi:hypothetical protein
MTNKYEQQLNREKQSQTAGYKKFDETTLWNEKTGNASNNDFGLFVKQHLLGEIVERVEQKTKQVIGTKGREVPNILCRCLKAMPDGTTTDFFDAKEAAFLGLQKVLDNVLNPNQHTSTTQGKSGGDKRLMEKQRLNELEHSIGTIIHNQMSLRFIQKTFPAWFRQANKKAEVSTEGGNKATTGQWEYRMERAMKSFAEYLRSNGNAADADLMENRKCWTYRECSVIGALVVSAVLDVCGEWIEVYTKTKSVKGKPRKVSLLRLTSSGEFHRQRITSFARQFSHDLLPMLVEPNPITNDKLGGWFANTLQDKDHPHTGSILLSGQHLEFINRQARVKFEINPFIHNLLKELDKHNKTLGKFKVEQNIELPSIASELGLAWMGAGVEQDYAVRNHPQFKEKCREHAEVKDRNLRNQKDRMYARLLLEKADKLKEDEYYHYPMDYDFRGRIYSRVPFINFQGTDAGRYLLRFHEKTPIDGRTKFWLKVGIANAGGADKVCWDDRVRWFDNNYEDIINVGKLFDNGDFNKAYEFLLGVDDPFCLAALANEYVKVFVDKTQTFTQVFVYLDCSCSGTSIFNAWRRNTHGARMTNLIDTPEPADIYMEVWYEIKRLMPSGVFRASHIKRLEKSKLLRKMMKTTYIPASYASPQREQHSNLYKFNREKLAKAGLDFKEGANYPEMETLCKLWDVALDKVSSINSVMGWFQARVIEAVEAGREEITYTTSNGSVMTLKYPKSKRKKVKTIHYGSGIYRDTHTTETSTEIDKRKMAIAITANITHATDAAALCGALWNCETPFAALHDAIGMPPSKLMDDGAYRYKRALIDACRHDVWDVFRSNNGLPIDALTAPPIIGDLDLEDIIHSNYIFA